MMEVDKRAPNSAQDHLKSFSGLDSIWIKFTKGILRIVNG